MKKIALLLFVAVQALSVNAQQSINFKIAYKPNTVYKQTTEQATTSTISYGEDMEPMEQEATTNMTHITKTGKLANGAMSIIIEMAPEKGSEMEMVMPNGATAYGIVKQDGVPQIDSVNAPGMPAQTKEIMLSTMRTMAGQNLVPAARTVKVGESFTVDTPIEMPIGPATMNMNTKTTYKLNRVEGKKAYFDLTMSIDMKTNAEGQDMKGTGSGSGTMVYDIDNNFFTNQDIKTDMNMNFEAQGMAMSMTLKQDSKIDVSISQNK